MALNIVVDENIVGARQILDALGSVRLVSGRSLVQSDLRDVDVLLVRSVTQVNESLLANTSVKFIGTATSGFDHVDRAYLQARDIGFAHAPGSNANSVVEYVLSVIAAVDDKLERLFAGATVGIIGGGHIGKRLAHRLNALGLSYKIYDPWLPQDAVPNSASLEGILQCELVTVHAELTSELPWPSLHLLGAAELAQMSSDTLLINASRGAVVDNQALQTLLGKGGGPSTVLDVWEDEPALSPQLLSLVRFGSAHTAGYSRDGKLLAIEMLKVAMLEHLDLPTPSDEGGAPVGAPEFTLPAGIGGLAAVRCLLHHYYHPEQDDRLLRAAVTQCTTSQAAANFDRLRKEYRSRRELLGSVVKTDTKDAATLKLIRALGACVAYSAGERQ